LERQQKINLKKFIDDCMEMANKVVDVDENENIK
jgi:hypothetical protein